MTEARVVDPLASVDTVMVECFGEWDIGFRECTVVCEVRVMCEKQTKAAPTLAPSAPALEGVEELPEMDPKEFLIEMLKGRYDLETSTTDGVMSIRCRKDGRGRVSIKITEAGRYYFQTQGVKCQLEKLESVRQASYIFKAILVV